MLILFVLLFQGAAQFGEREGVHKTISQPVPHRWRVWSSAQVAKWFRSKPFLRRFENVTADANIQGFELPALMDEKTLAGLFGVDAFVAKKMTAAIHDLIYPWPSSRNSANDNTSNNSRTLQLSFVNSRNRGMIDLLAMPEVRIHEAKWNATLDRRQQECTTGSRHTNWPVYSHASIVIRAFYLHLGSFCFCIDTH